jgi:2'-5' RNA ligase
LIRAFLAIELDDATRELALQAQRTLGDSARKLPAESLHITIKFLGDVEDAAARATFDALVLPSSSAPLGAAKLDAFPSAARGKIIVLSCDDPSGEIAALAARAEEAAFTHAGVAREERKFHAHVTLARSKTPVDIRKIATRFGTRPCGQPNRVVLYRSELGQSGARHTELAARSFG